MSINIFAKEKLFSGLTKEITIEKTFSDPPRKTAQISLYINDIYVITIMLITRVILSNQPYV